MTITDLKAYAERMNKQFSPADKFTVTLTRDAMTYVGAFLLDRKAALEKSLTDPKIKSSKAAKRAIEYGFVTEVLSRIEKAKEL